MRGSSTQANQNMDMVLVQSRKARQQLRNAVTAQAYMHVHCCIMCAMCAVKSGIISAEGSLSAWWCRGTCLPNKDECVRMCV